MVHNLNPVYDYHHTNLIGRDFVIGDIHGEYDQLMTCLNKIEFDKSKDRLFCVGDLIDRGPKSEKVLTLLKEDWIFSVLGNHEDMMIKSLNSDGSLCWGQHGFGIETVGVGLIVSLISLN